MVVDDLGVFLVGVPVVGARAVLQLGDGVGRPHMLLAAHAPDVLAACVQCVGQHRVFAVGHFMGAQGFFGDVKHADAFDAAGGAGEVLADGLAGQANGFKQLRAAVAHIGAHAHFGHDLGQAFAHGFDVVVNGFFGAQGTRQARAHVRQGFHRQVGMYRFCAVTGQNREVVYLAGAARLHHQTGGGAQAFEHQVLVDGRERQQRRNGHLGGAHGAVADDQDVVTALDGVHRLGTQRRQLGLHALVAPGQRVSDVQRIAAELALRVALDIAQLGHVGEIEHRLGHFQAHGRVDLVDVQQIGFGPDKGHQRHDDGLADRVDRRVGHLGKKLLEVVVQRLVFVAEHGQGAVVTHRAQRLFAIGGHGRDQELEVFLGIAKGLLAVQQAVGMRQSSSRGFGRGNAVDFDAQVLNPLLVRAAVGQARFELFVVDHAALFEVDQEHLAGLQTPFANNLALGHGQHARLGTHDHQVVVGDAIARGAQAVAVQGGANLAAIGEHDGRGAVPGFEHGGVVFIERAATGVHGAVVFPWLGNHHHHGLADWVTRHGQQL